MQIKKKKKKKIANPTELGLSQARVGLDLNLGLGQGKDFFFGGGDKKYLKKSMQSVQKVLFYHFHAESSNWN